MTRNPAAWAEVRSLFEQALPLARAAREALLGEPQRDAAVVAEVRSLLEHHAATGAMALETPADIAPLQGASPARSGQRLGAWRLASLLGRGGMGEVWLAERADGAFSGRAAVKLLKRGMDSAAVLARFAQERQALARLAHPNIARLLDAGATEEGLPYFVLEHVSGRNIEEAVRGLAIPARIALFLQLTDAVAYAHRNLLVHRDLKPGNVLVDGEGRVKLLDFGIAKALDPLEGSDVGATALGERPFTPQYASPEQVRGEPVTTATDVYSLGVLLYQLLTGMRPTGRGATTAAEAARCVLEEEPAPPSRLARELTLDPQWAATSKSQRGDLDHIVLRALAKPLSERYASVDALAADLRACLEGRPVSARAPRPGYVLGKFLRRHRVAVFAAAMGALGLLAGLVATLLQGRVAMALGLAGLALGLGLALVQGQRALAARDAARERLKEMKALLRTMVQQHADAITHLPGGLPTKAAMLEDAIRNLDRLAQSAADDHEIAATLAGSYARLAEVQGGQLSLSMGKPASAEAHARQALQWFARVPAGADVDASFHLWQASCYSLLGRVERDRARLPEALAHYERSVQVLQAALQRLPGDLELRRSLAAKYGELGQLFDTVTVPSFGRGDEALRWFAQARDLYEALIAEAGAAEDRFHLALVEGSCAVVYHKRDELEQALPHLVRAEQVTAELAAASRGLDTANELGHAMTLNNLAFQLGRLARHEEARQAARKAFRISERLLAAEPDNLNWKLRRGIIGMGYADALLNTGGHCEAEPLLTEFEALWVEQLGRAEHANAADTARRRIATARLALARCRAAAGEPVPALALADAAEAQFAALAHSAPDDRERLLMHGEALGWLAQFAAAAGDSATAARRRQQALERYDAAAALGALTHDHLRARQALG